MGQIREKRKVPVGLLLSTQAIEKEEVLEKITHNNHSIAKTATLLCYNFYNPTN